MQFKLYQRTAFEQLDRWIDALKKSKLTVEKAIKNILLFSLFILFFTHSIAEATLFSSPNLYEEQTSKINHQLDDTKSLFSEYVTCSIKLLNDHNKVIASLANLLLILGIFLSPFLVKKFLPQYLRDWEFKNTNIAITYRETKNKFFGQSLGLQIENTGPKDIRLIEFYRKRFFFTKLLMTDFSNDLKNLVKFDRVVFTQHKDPKTGKITEPNQNYLTPREVSFLIFYREGENRLFGLKDKSFLSKGRFYLKVNNNVKIKIGNDIMKTLDEEIISRISRNQNTLILQNEKPKFLSRKFYFLYTQKSDKCAKDNFDHTRPNYDQCLERIETIGYDYKFHPFTSWSKVKLFSEIKQFYLSEGVNLEPKIEKNDILIGQVNVFRKIYPENFSPKEPEPNISLDLEAVAANLMHAEHTLSEEEIINSFGSLEVEIKETSIFRNLFNIPWKDDKSK